jgi:hypothetical protein
MQEPSASDTTTGLKATGWLGGSGTTALHRSPSEPPSCHYVLHFGCVGGARVAGSRERK